MRVIYLALLLSSYCMHAQLLTQSFNEPIVGDVDRNFRLDTSLFTSGLPVSTTGSTSTWNFMNLLGAYPMVIDSFIAPQAVSSSSAYPGTSYVQHRDILFSYYKSTNSPQQTELLGAYSPSLSLTFTNSAVIAGYPVNYGYYLSDPVSGSFKYNTTNGACNGSITISADGLGNVNFPGGVTINNVIRLKSVEILTLSIGILPFGSFNQTIYNYYKPGKKFPILSINYTIYQLLAGTPTITALVYGSDQFFNVAGITEGLNSTTFYKVFPNPFHDSFCIQNNLSSEQSVFSIYDINARLLSSSNSIETLKTENLPQGIYYLEIKNPKGVFRQKILKE